LQILDEKSLFPHILGLTSSLLKDDPNANDIKLKVEKMERLLHSTVRTKKPFFQICSISTKRNQRIKKTIGDNRALSDIKNTQLTVALVNCKL